MILVGIDENGYGPKLGPLVATAVAVEVPNLKAGRLTGRESFVRDSKDVFKRRASAYARGETTVLEILSMEGHRPASLRSLVDRYALLKFEALCERAGPDVAGMLRRHAENLRLPAWLPESLSENPHPHPLPFRARPCSMPRHPGRGDISWPHALRGKGESPLLEEERVRVRRSFHGLTGIGISSKGVGKDRNMSHEIKRWPIKGIALALLPPRTFNQLIPAKGSKAFCDFSLFMDLVIYGPPGDKYVFGKVGGTRRYTPFLMKYRAERLALIPPWETVNERPEESLYRFSDGREFRFVRDADAQFAPVALASMVGKYVRELFMLAENRHFGLEREIPEASGYPGDPRTKDLVLRIRSRYPATAESHWIRQR